MSSPSTDAGVFDAATAVDDGGPLPDGATCTDADASLASCTGHYDHSAPISSYPFRFENGASTCIETGEVYECQDGDWTKTGTCTAGTGCASAVGNYATGAQVCLHGQGLWECNEGGALDFVSGRCDQSPGTFGMACQSEYEVDATFYSFWDGTQICRASSGTLRLCSNGDWSDAGSCTVPSGGCENLGMRFPVGQNVCFDAEGMKVCTSDGTFTEVAPNCWTAIGPRCIDTPNNRIVALPFGRELAFSNCRYESQTYYFEVEQRSRVSLSITSLPTGWEPVITLGRIVDGECLDPEQVAPDASLTLSRGRFLLELQSEIVGSEGTVQIDLDEVL